MSQDILCNSGTETFEEMIGRLYSEHSHALEEQKAVLTQLSALNKQKATLEHNLRRFSEQKDDLIHVEFTSIYKALEAKNNHLLQRDSDARKNLFDDDLVRRDGLVVTGYADSRRTLETYSPDALPQLDQDYQAACDREAIREEVRRSINEPLEVIILAERMNGHSNLYIPLKFSGQYEERLMNSLSAYLQEMAIRLEKKSIALFEESPPQEYGRGKFTFIQALTDQPGNHAKMVEVLNSGQPDDFSDTSALLRVVDMETYLSGRSSVTNQVVPTQAAKTSPDSTKDIFFRYSSKGVQGGYLLPRDAETRQSLIGKVLTFDAKEEPLEVKMSNGKALYMSKGFLANFEEGVLRAKYLAPDRYSLEQQVALVSGKDTLYWPVTAHQIKNSQLPFGERSFWKGTGDEIILEYDGNRVVHRSPKRKDVSKIGFQEHRSFIRELHDGGLEAQGYVGYHRTKEKDAAGRRVFQILIPSMESDIITSQENISVAVTESGLIRDRNLPFGSRKFWGSGPEVVLRYKHHEGVYLNPGSDRKISRIRGTSELVASLREDGLKAGMSVQYFSTETKDNAGRAIFEVGVGP